MKKLIDKGDELRSTIEQSITKITRTSGGIEADVCFPASAPIFKGHFPGKPIVPAVYQMAMCRLLAERYYPGTFVMLSRSRFSAPCEPDVLYTLKITAGEPSAGPGRAVVNCLFSRDGVMHSKVVFLYEKPATQG